MDKQIYDWLDEPALNDAEASAKKWLDEFCKQPTKKDEKWLERQKVTALWKGKRYHVSGASRMGDVWLRDEGSSNFYDHRIDVTELSEWEVMEIPEIVEQPEKKPKMGVGGILAMTAMMMGAGGMAWNGIPGLGRYPSGASIRNDPDREKTPEDLKKIEKARIKREQKSLKKIKN